jgi:hypothetical protein
MLRVFQCIAFYKSRCRYHLPPNHPPNFMETWAKKVWWQHQRSKTSMATPSATLLYSIQSLLCIYSRISMSQHKSGSRRKHRHRINFFPLNRTSYRSLDRGKRFEITFYEREQFYIHDDDMPITLAGTTCSTWTCLALTSSSQETSTRSNCCSTIQTFRTEPCKKCRLYSEFV